jgi:hypothetical protein
MSEKVDFVVSTAPVLARLGSARVKFKSNRAALVKPAFAMSATVCIQHAGLYEKKGLPQRKYSKSLLSLGLQWQKL